MMNGTNDKQGSEPGMVMSREPSLRRWGIVASLWTMIGLAIGVCWYASPILAIVVIYATYKLAGWCSKRYQTHMLPQSFTAKLSGSTFYQIYVVRAVHRQGSHLLLYVAGISFGLYLSNCVDLLNPNLELPEMEVKTGTVTKVVIRQNVGTRKVCGDIVYMKAGDGTLHRYNALLNDDALRILRDSITNDVTLWSMKIIQLPPCAVMNWITQVQIGNKIVQHYHIDSYKSVRKWQSRLNIILPITGILAMLGIWFADKKATISSCSN